MLNRFFFVLKHLAPRVAHNPQIMSGNTLISPSFSLTGDEGDGDDEEDSAQAESTRLQLENKRRSVFTPSSHKTWFVVSSACVGGGGARKGGPIPRAWLTVSGGDARLRTARHLKCSADSDTRNIISILLSHLATSCLGTSGHESPWERQMWLQKKPTTTPPPAAPPTGCVTEQPQV